MLEMYAPMVNSPITELATAIDDTQTTIEVVDGSKLPDAPNLAMIGLGENTETILYTQKDGNVLSGVTRGFQGVAKAWPQGIRVARFFAAYDQMAIQENIKTLNQSLATHLNDFAQVWNNRIVEMGSNANGTYVRWENGLQICWHWKTVSTTPQTETVQGLTLYKASDTWIFPAAFVSVPVVFHDGDITGEGYLEASMCGGASTTQVNVWIETLKTFSSFLSRRLAIGRWM